MMATQVHKRYAADDLPIGANGNHYITQTQLGRVRWASRRGEGEPNPPRETKNSRRERGQKLEDMSFFVPTVPGGSGAANWQPPQILFAQSIVISYTGTVQ